MSGKAKIIGDVFGFLTVVSEADRNARGIMWNCLCKCGNTKVLDTNSLRSGKTKSCGCYNALVAKQRMTSHGLTESAEYVTWTSMKTRCLNPNSTKYQDYGGRGITVCERWVNSFENFLADMGKRPSSRHSLDRYPDLNGNYEPLNCRWATTPQQGRNKRNNVMIETNGFNMPLSAWAELMGIPYMKLYGKHKKDKNYVSALLKDHDELLEEIKSKL